MDPKSYLAEVCVDVSFHLGGINQIFSDKNLKDDFLTSIKFKNFLNEMLIEARNGKITALALNLATLQKGLRDMQKDGKQRSDITTKAIDDAVWKCERAIETIYKYENVDSNLYFLFGRPEDDQ